MLSPPTSVQVGGISLKEEPGELCYAQTAAGLTMHPRAQVTDRYFHVACRILTMKKHTRAEKRPVAV